VVEHQDDPPPLGHGCEDLDVHQLIDRVRGRGRVRVGIGDGVRVGVGDGVRVGVGVGVRVGGKVSYMRLTSLLSEASSFPSGLLVTLSPGGAVQNSSPSLAHTLLTCLGLGVGLGSGLG